MTEQTARCASLGVNLLIVFAAGATGYFGLPAEASNAIEAYQFLAVATFATLVIFVPGALSYARTRCDAFRAPSILRFNLHWWYDPFQTLLVTFLAALATAAGAQFRYVSIRPVGYDYVVWYWSIVAGLLVGQIIGYAIYGRFISRD